MPQGANTVENLLKSASQTSKTGQAQLVLLEGAAGFGKSHALRNFSARVHTGLTFQIPSSAWLAALLRLCHTHLESERDPAFLEAARRTAPDLRWAQVAQAPTLNDQNSLWNAIAHALERLAKRVGGLTLLLEDAHDASPDDLGSIRAFYRRALLGAAPVFFVISTRPTPTDVLEGFNQDAAIASAPEPTRFELQKLEEAGVETLVRTHLQSEFLPENLSAWLYARAEGHPLHTLELLRFLRDGGSLRQTGFIWVFRTPMGKGVPVKLETLLQARLQSIQPDTQAWSAMMGLCLLEREVSITQWAKLCSQSSKTMLEVAQRLEFHGLIYETLELGETTYAVRHPLYVPIVKMQIPFAERLKLHRKAMLISKTNAERACHARACQDEQALELSHLALQEAELRHAHQELIEHAQYLLSLESTQTDQIRTSLANALFILGETQQALEITEQPSTHHELLTIRFHVLLRLGEFQQALEITRKAQQHAPEELILYLNEALALMHLEQLDQAQQVVESLLLRFPEQSAKRGKALDILADIVYSRGDLRASLEIGMQAVEMLREFGDQKSLAITLTNLGGCCGHFGLWDQGQVFLEEAIALFTARGQFQHVMFARNNLGFLMVESAKYPRARKLLLGVYQQAHVAKEIRVEAAALSCLADLEWQSGHLDLAMQYQTQSRALEQRESESLVDYAHLEALHGNLEVALSLIHEPQTPFHPQKTPKRVRIALLAGQFEQAKTLLDQAENPEDHDTYRASLRLLRGFTRFKLGLKEQAQTDFLEATQLAKAGQNQAIALEAKLALGLVLEQFQAARETKNELLAIDAGGHLFTCQSVFAAVWEQVESESATSLTSTHSMLHTLGTFTLERDGKITTWKASKTRELLAVLLVAYLRENGPRISKTQIIDTLWAGDLGDESTESKFRVTLKRLRDALGDAARIHNLGGMYELRDLKADVVFFLESLERLDFDAALGWYKGGFLTGIDVPETEIIRAQLWQRFRDTALKTSFETSNPNLLEKLHHLEPLDVGILERYLAVIADDAFRSEQVLTRAKNVFEREIGEIPLELRQLERV